MASMASISDAVVERTLAGAREVLSPERLPVFSRELSALISQAAEAQPSLARAASQLGAVEAQLEAVRGELADARLSAETEAAGELLVREEAARLRGELEAGVERAGRSERALGALAGELAALEARLASSASWSGDQLEARAARSARRRSARARRRTRASGWRRRRRRRTRRWARCRARWRLRRARSRPRARRAT